MEADNEAGLLTTENSGGEHQIPNQSQSMVGVFESEPKNPNEPPRNAKGDQRAINRELELRLKRFANFWD